MRWAALGLIVLGGCLGPIGSDVPSATRAADLAREAPLVATDCVGYHAIYYVPAEGFERYVPNGFTLYEEPTPSLTILYSIIDECAEHDDLFLVLRVEAPPELANETYGDFVPVAIRVSKPDVAERFTAWGFGASIGASAFEHDLGYDTPAGRHDRIVIRDDAGSWTQTTTPTPSSGAFSARVLRVWSVTDGEATGTLLGAWDESRTTGVGSAFLRVEPPREGLGPLHEGIVHQVAGLNANYTYAPRQA